eukprot:scaffold56119_cov66-Phaeocystis_antarctica.AAC.2
MKVAMPPAVPQTTRAARAPRTSGSAVINTMSWLPLCEPAEFCCGSVAASMPRADGQVRDWRTVLREQRRRLSGVHACPDPRRPALPALAFAKFGSKCGRTSASASRQRMRSRARAQGLCLGARQACPAARALLARAEWCAGLIWSRDHSRQARWTCGLSTRS